MTPEQLKTPFREHEFLHWLKTEFGSKCDSHEGVGDDAAWIADTSCPDDLWAMDTVVEGVHTPNGGDALARLGRKAVLVNLSDIAAMGGRPTRALLSMSLNRGTSLEEAQACAREAIETGKKHGIEIVGGDTVVADGPASVSVAMSGRSHASGPVFRSGAREGDLLLVTGQLGGSFHDGRHEDFNPRIAEAGLILDAVSPTAMADISDGLLRDLQNILSASETGAVVDLESLPVHPSADAASLISGKSRIQHALHDGEDFELLFTLPPQELARLENVWKTSTQLTVIGSMEKEGLFLREGDTLKPATPGGFDHGRP